MRILQQTLDEISIATFQRNVMQFTLKKKRKPSLYSHISYVVSWFCVLPFSHSTNPYLSRFSTFTAFWIRTLATILLPSRINNLIRFIALINVDQIAISLSRTSGHFTDPLWQIEQRKHTLKYYVRCKIRLPLKWSGLKNCYTGCLVTNWARPKKKLFYVEK